MSTSHGSPRKVTPILITGHGSHQKVTDFKFRSPIFKIKKKQKYAFLLNNSTGNVISKESSSSFIYGRFLCAVIIGCACANAKQLEEKVQDGVERFGTREEWNWG